MESSSESDTPLSKKHHKCSFRECNAAFSRNSKLIVHIRKHTGERPFVCDQSDCKKTYTNASHLRRHKKTSHEEQSQHTESLLCEYDGCGLVLSNKYSLKKHINRKHNLAIYPFKCKDCGQGFNKRNKLQEHTYLHTGAASFSCDLCDIKFTTSTHLNKHKRRHRVYNCDCGQSFNTWSLMLKHKKICSDTKYPCDQCDRVFLQGSNLKNHKLTHQQKFERLVYMCPYSDCGRIYFYKKNIKFHIDYIHKKKYENIRYKCTYPKCTVTLKTKQSLRIHLSKMHFKFTKKKEKRRPRRDKGIPKKRIIPSLSQVPSTNLIEQSTNSENNRSNNNVLDSSITDEELLQKCDEILAALTDKNTVSVK